jgi:hypothetical protein
MTPRDAVTPIANLIERLWPRDIAYLERDQRAVASHPPGLLAPRALGRSYGARKTISQNCS